MSQVGRLILITTYVAVFFTLIGCTDKNHKSPEKHTLSNRPPAKGVSNIIRGKIVKALNAAGYTYLQLDTKNGRVWAAIPASTLKEGDNVTLVQDMVLRNFKSNSLNRVFDRIIFATEMKKGNNATRGASFSPHGHGGTSFMPGSATKGHGSKSIPLPSNVHIKKAEGENGFTISEIYQKRKELNGKIVVVNGYVTKVLTGIMGKNWVHIQDGSVPMKGLVGDLVVTTNDLPNPGDTVTVTGRLASDRDFGAGYRYDAIIEDAKIDVISKALRDLSKK